MTDPRPDWTRRPASDEYSDFTRSYVEMVPDGDLIATLEREGPGHLARLRALPPELEGHRYAPGKWSIREAVGHCIDTERVLTLRALWFARGAPTALPAFEETDWGRVSNAGDRTLRELTEEWETVRRATLYLFRSFDAESVERRGIANGKTYSVRGLAWVVTGHDIHHRKVLEERYLK